ncbi:DUF3237 family protein [Streptomyces sp. NPDC102406]|uniref:DUF3237 family protein n=1 Tax=Streptomyces sp. NPDC102406 TaxID=3366171 RepID=UPI00380BCFA0
MTSVPGTGRPTCRRRPDRPWSRSTFDTHDGASLYVQYYGLIEMTEGIKKVLAGGNEPTLFGEGRLLPGLRIEFRVYRVAVS